MSWLRGYWVVVAITLVVFGLMQIWTLPAISIGGLEPFDLRPQGYSTAEAQNYIDSLSSEAKATYLGPQRVLDWFFPALLGSVLIGAFVVLVPHWLLRWGLIIVALGGMIADFSENYLVARLLRFEGPVPDALVNAASQATTTKSALSGLAIGAFLAALALTALSKWKSR